MKSTRTTPSHITTELPSDVPAAIRHAKTRLREQIGDAAALAEVVRPHPRHGLPGPHPPREPGSSSLQGWTALSDMRPTDGVLHVVPIPSAMAYVLLRALQEDVADDDLCGAANGQALPIREKWHSVLLPALSPIPAVEPGDSVWTGRGTLDDLNPVGRKQLGLEAW